MELIWQDFLKIAEMELGIRAVETWIKAVSFYRYDEAMQKVYLKAPNSFVKDWLFLTIWEHALFYFLFQLL